MIFRMSTTTTITPGVTTRKKNANGDPLYPDYMRELILIFIITRSKF